MWYLAAKYESEEIAGRAYTPLQVWLKREGAKPTKLNASVFRLKIFDIWHVCILGEGEFSEEAKKNAVSILIQEGTITEMPRNVLEQIASKRSIRIKDAKIDPVTKTAFTETHEPTAIDHLPTTSFTNLTFDNVAEGIEQSIEDEAVKRVNISTDFLESLKKKPFIIAYQSFCEKVYVYEWEDMLSKVNMDSVVPSHIDEQSAKDVVHRINRINFLRLKRSQKYMLSSSAITLHNSVSAFHQEVTLHTTRGLHTWIECHEQQNTPYGNMRAVFFCDAFPLEEIEIVASPHKNLREYDRLVNSYSMHNGKYGLEIIDDEYNVLFDFTYDRGINEWIFLPSHKCPLGKCTYPSATNIDERMYQELEDTCNPCEYCIKACKFFAQWLVTALAMIEGEYSTTSEEATFQKEEKPYSDMAMVTVGSGKNKRLIKKPVTRQVEYTIVTYDLAKQASKLTTEESEEIEHAKRNNWLVTTPSGEIIWRRANIKAYDRKFPVRKDGTRQEGLVSIKHDFKKWVPMLRVPKRAKITKIVASHLTQKD